MGHRTAPPPLQSAQELDLSICQFVFLFVFGTDLLHTLCCLYLAETFDLSILVLKLFKSHSMPAERISNARIRS